MEDDRLPPGTILEGHYKLGRLIGEGAMAQVYLAHHLALNTSHAVKVLRPHLVFYKDFRNRFLAEGQIQGQLSHPHIVRVTGIVRDPVPGLVMDYIDGSNLESWLAERGPITDPEEVVALMGPLLDAVGHAHERGIIHRDLKPENILIVERGGKPFPMVSDFGVAKVLKGNALRTGKAPTLVPTRMGSIPFMSPEQIVGDSALGPPADIFALGGILYQILSGEMAYPLSPNNGSPDDGAETMRKIRAGDHRPLLSLNPSLSPALSVIAAQALAVSPKDRFQSCAEFKQALRAAEQGDFPIPPPQKRPAAKRPLFASPREDASSPPPAQKRPPPTPPPPKPPRVRRSIFATSPVMGIVPLTRASRILIALAFSAVTLLAHAQGALAASGLNLSSSGAALVGGMLGFWFVDVAALAALLGAVLVSGSILVAILTGGGC